MLAWLCAAGALLWVLVWRFVNGRQTVVDVFEAQAKRRPRAVALVFEGREFTWAEFDARCNQVAYWAAEEGFKPRDVVALMMDNCPEFLFIWLGLAKAGISTALINTGLRGLSLKHSLSVCNAVAAVVGEEYAAACADLELPIRWHVLASSSDNGGGSVPVPAGFEWLRERLATYPAAAPPRRWRESIGGDDVLLFIYTSGTTGLPKASLIRHSRFFLAGASFVAFSGVRDDDRIYLALPIYHGTGGMVAVSMSFCTGAALVLRRKFSASAFFRECRETRATVFFYVGQLCRYLCHSPPDVQEREHSVRLAIGNGMAADVWRQLVSRFGVPSVLEFYASTEGNATMFNPFNRVGAVGYLPWAARFFYPVKLVAFDVEREAPLRDARGRCVEIMRCGQPGELVGKIVDSDPLRRFDGYTQKEASAKKVLTDAFAPGDRWFRSGDLLSRDEEGFLYFVDRIGDTFRWKGENVSTGEVAAVLHAHPAVADCNVYGVRVAGYDGRAGMAAITLREPSGPVPADLYSFLQGHLPPFAQPLFVRLLPELELTGTFKHKKADLVAQGFDPSVVSDRLFVRIDRERRFAPLTAALFASIAAGRERL